MENAIDDVVRAHVSEPIGPNFMAPPLRAPFKAAMRGTAGLLRAEQYALGISVTGSG
jgi:hypothetical protein